MRHAVNMGLLCSFIALFATGVLGFVKPFSIATTRMHVIAGFASTVLVLCHIVARQAYFAKAFSSRMRGFSATMLAVVLSLSVGLSWLAFWGWTPFSFLMNQSYEFRHRQEIFRASSLVGFGQPSPHCKVVVRDTMNPTFAKLSVLLNFSKSISELPAIAVWAESTNGTMIETLYLDQSFAFSEKVSWDKKMLGRQQLLPIWRHRYTLVSGMDPDGKVDAISGATENHQFAIDNFFAKGQGNRFVLCVELNARADPNADWTDATIGQPSLLYTTLIEVDRDQEYTLLELTGHGGGAADDGNIQYDLNSITTARGLADLFLAKIETTSSDKFPTRLVNQPTANAQSHDKD